MLKFLIKKIIGYSVIKRKNYDEFIQTILYPYCCKSQIKLCEAIFLKQLVELSNNFFGPIIEVGTLFGWSTRIIAITKTKAKKMYTIDNFRWNPCSLPQDVHKYVTGVALKEAIDEFALELVDIEKSIFYKKYYEPPPSLVFFDADHSYEGTSEDLRWAKRVDAKIIAGHDYCIEHPEVMKAFGDAFNREPDQISGSLCAFFI